LSNTLPPNQLFTLQEGIVKYLDASKFASWNILKKNINSLYVTLCGNGTDIPDSLEYKVLHPLLRTGIIETARRPETDKLVYCLGPYSIIETKDNPIIEIDPAKNSCRVIDRQQIDNYKQDTINRDACFGLLKSIPSLNSIISHWYKSEAEVYFIYERFAANGNHFLTARDVLLPNIYTSRDKVYANKYLRIENGTLYRIPEIEDNVDGFNIACCYLESIKRHFHFTFNETSKELSSWTFHTMLPVVVCRALILCDPMVLVDGRVYNYGEIIIRQISNDHITELKRIFGESAVEIKHD
jgi:hypothetical protein